MEKLFKYIIGLGFLITVIGGIAYVGGQLLGFVIGNPELMSLMESSITKVIFPAASISGLLCFVYYYIFRKNTKTEDV